MEERGGRREREGGDWMSFMHSVQISKTYKLKCHALHCSALLCLLPSVNLDLRRTLPCLVLSCLAFLLPYLQIERDM